MNLNFNLSLVDGYKSASQIARVLTEDWFAHNMYCPICGEESIRHADTNAPVKDFVCEYCKSQYELKSKKNSTSSFSSSVADGVYQTMISRITSLDNPNFFFLHYDCNKVNNLIIVPKCFFVPSVIEKRKPLSANARRSGWLGCNILLNNIPNTAKIPIIVDGVARDKQRVLSDYKKVYSLQSNSLEGRGWLVDMFSCLELLNQEFTLQDVYSFADNLQRKHPLNNHVHAKMRQQLQILRDKGFVEFKGNGRYKKVKSDNTL